MNAIQPFYDFKMKSLAIHTLSPQSEGGFKSGESTRSFLEQTDDIIYVSQE